MRLDVSFRSAQPVLDAVDAVFADAAARAGLSIADDDGAGPPVRSRAGAPGVVELWPLLEPDPRRRGRRGVGPPLDAATEASPPVRLARASPRASPRWIGGARDHAPDGTPIRPGDVLILVRRRGVLFEAMI